MELRIPAGSLRETGASIKTMAAGAAIATVISRFVEVLIIVLWAFSARKKHDFLIGLYKTLLVPKDATIKIIRKSLPIFFNEFLGAGGIAVLTQCYSRRGLDIVAGMNISNALCNMLNVVFIALGNAVGILVGQTLGAGRYKDARDEAFRLMWFTGGGLIYIDRNTYLNLGSVSELL